MRVITRAVSVFVATSLAAAALAADLWTRRTVEVTNSASRPVVQLVSVPLDDLSLPDATRLEALRLIDPRREQRVPFEVDRETRVLRWLVDLRPGAKRPYHVFASGDPDLLPVDAHSLPAPVRTAGAKGAGNLSYELTCAGPGASLSVLFQDNVPYEPDVTQTHSLPLTAEDEKWRQDLWRRRPGIGSFRLDGQELVAGHWPGHWSALSYYYDQRPYGFARLDEVSLTRGCLTGCLNATGMAENYAYGWGKGLHVRLAIRTMPVGRVHVQWTLTAAHDLAVVPETGRPAQPAGAPSIQAFNFLPEFIQPAFNRALWHDEQGRLQRADVSVAQDRTFFSGRPAGAGWCALYHRERHLLLGLVPEEWGDGGRLLMAANDAEGYPCSVLQMRMVGTPGATWAKGESRTWSYWLLAMHVRAEDESVWAMDALSASVGGGGEPSDPVMVRVTSP